MGIDDIGPLRAGDEGLDHQIVDTFATIAESDRSWTEKIWASIARTDGSLQLDFGLGKYHNRGIIDGFGGVSRGREQWTVRGSGFLSGLDRILRTPPSEAGLLPPYDMARQFRIMEGVGRAAGGPPVPRMRELCEDPAVIGDEFFTMDRARGEAYEAYEMPEWVKGADAAFRSAMCEQWIDAVAAVHALPTEVIGDEPRTPAGEADHWRRVAADAESPAELVDLLARLAGDPPPLSGPPAPLHGDAKLGNCLWQDGRLTALLDWEMAGVGEPLVDLGYLLWTYETYRDPDCPGWWTREQVIARWQQRTGRMAVDLARYEVLGMAKVIAILAAGVHLVKSGRSVDPRFAAWAAIVPPMTAAAAARLEEALA